jgi:dipeptidyl aminopeptidase/acylaminoacyl peptidase
MYFCARLLKQAAAPLAIFALAIFGLAIFGPAAMAAEPPPLDAYGDLPGIEDMAISTSGNRIAAVSIIDGRRMLLLLNSDMVLEAMHALGEVKVRSIEWIGDDSVLLVRSDTQELGADFAAESFEAYNAIIIPWGKNIQITQVFQEQRNMAAAVFGSYGLRQVGNRWLGYFGGLELRRTTQGFEFDHGRPALFETDMTDGAIRRIAHPAAPGATRRWLLDADGRIAATFEIADRNGEWRIVNSAGKQLAAGQDPEGDAGLVAIGRGGKTIVYFAQNPDSGLTDWWEAPMDGSAPALEILDEADIARTFLDKGTGELTGYLDDSEGRPRPVFFDPARQEAIDKVMRAFASRNAAIADWSADFGRVLVRTDGNGDSGSWFLVDIAKREARPLGNERTKIPADAVGPISTITYQAADGLEIEAILTLPPGREARALPVVVLPHGGPHSRDRPMFDWWAQAFASRGYAVLQPNFRGSTNKTEGFIRAGYGEWGRKMQSDLSDGLAELVRLGIADPARACIVGASYGGYAALAGVTLQQGLYRCAVAVAPVSDLALMMRTDIRESGDSNLVRRALREELGKGSQLDEVSPRRFAARADAPILLIHGRQDTVVPFEQSERMASALKEAGKPYRLIELAEEDHWLSRSVTRRQMLRETLAFVQEHNPAP